MELDTIKLHLIVGHNADDAIISIYSSAAEKAISNYIGSPFNQENMVHAQAKLLLIGTWYANRESAVTGTMVNELPQGISFLLDAEKSVSV